ncbi:MAG: hypothetical protein EA359_11985 [Balneolaceae bacterium]|nr:MAG: hypothetical protein EA359_11985 [Balneolaceae bacterium]
MISWKVNFFVLHKGQNVKNSFTFFVFSVQIFISSILYTNLIPGNCYESIQKKSTYTQIQPS